MDITYSNNKMANLFNSEKKLSRKYGQLANKIQQRLNELSAFDCLNDVPRVPPPKCHEHVGDRKGQLSVKLNGNMRLFFIPINNPLPLKKDGGLDWTGVTKIQIIGIDDPH